MKRPILPVLIAACLPVIVALTLLASEATVQAAGPSISNISLDGTNVVVLVSVPNGVRKVTLESRTRLGAGTWVPRAVSRLDGSGSQLTFRVPKSAAAEILRVRTDTDEPLPASFYAGTNSFVAGAGTADPGKSAPPAAGDAAPTGGAANSAAGGAATTRDVVESDIWKLSGDTLYFFNQYRGLQVVDLTAPDAPVATGTFPLPAAGEEMYLLDGGYVALLAQSGCGSDGQVVLLGTSGGAPKQVGSLTVPGWIQESRLVGTALYVVSQSYQSVPGSNGSMWQWGSTVSSFDLSAPAAPVAKDTLWYSGYNNVIYATDEHLYVVTQSPSNWWQSIVNCVDISDPYGRMKALSSIITAGQVADKFKLNESNDVLTTISQSSNTSGQGFVTVLETFSLTDPTMPQKLGQLQLGQREQLHATRFDGNRVYVVTFYRVDPLWIVDLSDPTTPRIAGELQVPGWSTYIEPLGDRLVAIGINNTNDWRVAVSLFDVHDPANPALLSKVPLGVNSSWSEANNDEKAFSVLPDAGLILVPYQGYETNGYASRVQLIDLAADSLKGRGTIEHTFQPRRATLHNNRIYSISGKELLAVDAADRDQPVVRADVELSWTVDRVFLSGPYVIEVANGNSWFGWWSQGAATPPSIRVSKTSDPDTALTTFVLTNYLPVLGATVQNSKLYVAQGVSGYGFPILQPNQASGTPDTNAPNLFTSIFDLSALPALPQLGAASAKSKPLGWSPNLQAIWPSPGLLVWSGAGGGWGPWLADVGPAAGVATGGGSASGVGAASGVVGGGIIWWPYFWGGNGGRLFAFDVSTPAAPQFASEVNLTTNAWWSFSSPYTANSLVYVSHQSSEFVEGVILPGQVLPPPTVTVDKDTGALETNQPPVGLWVTRYYLDVVDYADPKSPTLRQPVNIPGQLNGLAGQGALLYTVAPHWTNWVTDWFEWLDASAYDGVSASLVSSLPLPKDWPHPLVIAGSSIFLSRPDTTLNSSQLETWTLSSAGKFMQLGATPIGSPTSTLVTIGTLLIAQQNNSGIVALDASDPTSLKPLGKGQPRGCLWFDLTHADAAPTEGLWAPLSDYGVLHIPLQP
jgi:uncharacterized secreted protein with C-terminal beta-propeller domain